MKTMSVVGARPQSVKAAMLTRALQELAENDAVRAVGLTGAGKLFSPGLDLQELVELDDV